MTEITLISPDVVICGSNAVFGFALEIFGGKENETDTDNGNKLKYFTFENTTFVSFYHPACRKRREAVFDYAEDIFKTLKAIKYEE